MVLRAPRGGRVRIRAAARRRRQGRSHGHRLDDGQNGPHRLTPPLRRTAAGGFEAIDWDTAIRDVAARLAAVRDAHGARAGVDEALVREAVARIAGARAFASFEDLGVQMNRHSTLVSDLHRLS